MQFTPKQIAILAGALLTVGILVFLFFANLRSGSAPSEVTFTVWGVFDDLRTFEKVIQDYRGVRPNVQVKYVELDETNYEEKLLDALAAGEGPDVFVMKNRWLLKHKDKLTPVLSPQFGLVRLRELFPQAVEQDFVSEGQIYALPLWFDTLALFYNRNLLDQAGVVEPPRTWNAFQVAVPQLRVLGTSGEFVRAGAAIGATERTVSRGVDLLQLLMLQNGTVMFDRSRNAADFISGGERGGNPGLAAFNFYLQFANALSSAYTWNDAQPSSLEHFGNGKVAMVFGYHRDYEALKRRAPFLDVAAAAMPQPEGAEFRIDYPEYWGLAVSKQSKAAGWAWDFAIFATTNASASKKYLEAGGHLPALRSLIAEKLDDPETGVFVRQALTARSWPEPDEKKVHELFNRAIASVLTGKADSRSALLEVQSEVNEIIE